MPRPKNSGFTLVEVLIVVSVLVILGLTILIGINPMAQILKGYDARRRADLADLRIALEAYYSDHNCYPPASILNKCGTDDLLPYLKIIPCDPQTKKPYKVWLIPNNSCPENYALYSPINSTQDAKANEISQCPNTITVHSPEMKTLDIVNGCSGLGLSCYVHYGCKNNACVVVAEDTIVSPCNPSYCYPNFCGGANLEEGNAKCQLPDSECQ